MSDRKCALIVTIVNRGHSESAMEAARASGATGGTVLNGRGTGLKEVAKFFGITITPEKEVILILTDEKQKKPIMQAIAKKTGLKTRGSGISFALPVDYVVGAPYFEAMFDVAGPFHIVPEKGRFPKWQSALPYSVQGCRNGHA